MREKVCVESSAKIAENCCNAMYPAILESSPSGAAVQSSNILDDQVYKCKTIDQCFIPPHGKFQINWFLWLEMSEHMSGKLFFQLQAQSLVHGWNRKSSWEWQFYLTEWWTSHHFLHEAGKVNGERNIKLSTSTLSMWQCDIYNLPMSAECCSCFLCQWRE